MSPERNPSDRKPDHPSTQVPETQSAVTELQSRVTFQEDTLQTLNRIIAAQDAKITRLQKQVQLLNDKLKDLVNTIDQGAGSNEQEPPPHY